MNVLAHNTTIIRNLAEIRHRENVPLVEMQYQSIQPMRTVPSGLFPPAAEVQKVVADIKDLKKPKPVSPAEFVNGKLKGKAPEEPSPTPEKRTLWNPFVRPSAEAQSAQSTSEPPCCPPSDPETALKPAPSPGPIVELQPEIIKLGGKPTRGSATTRPAKSADPAASEQPKLSEQPQGQAGQPVTKPAVELAKTGGREGKKKTTKHGGLLRRSKTSDDERSAQGVGTAASSMAELSAEAIKAARDLQRLQENIPEIRIGQGPVSKEEGEETIKLHQAMLEAGISDPAMLLKAAGNLAAIQPIIELPPARNHSLSEYMVLTPKETPERLHSLSMDALIPSGKTVAGHSLADDEAIEARLFAPRAHRLSADATISVQTAAPGHYLDADPTVNTPQQLFSHELLDDVVVQQLTKSPQPHGLDSDKKFSLAQNDRQPHSLQSDKQIHTAQRQPHLHGLHTDKMLPGVAKSRQHGLHSDYSITPKASIRTGHDIAHNVRILSPSGQVRDPYSVGADEVVKESAVFRKSPHPDAMSGHYARSDSSGDAGENAMASLNASLQNAGQALGELNRALEGKENAIGTVPPSGQGFWGRVFGRKESQEESQALREESVRDSQGTQGAQGTST